jgi:hypothetical protein
MRLSFRALTTDVQLEIDDEMPQAELARALVSTYAPAIREPTLHYTLTKRQCSRDGKLLFETEEPLDLVPLFELDFYEQLVLHALPGWILHAAAIEIGESMVVLAGASGAGKTTLTLELVSRGHRLMTEEIVWIGREGNVCGLSRPLHVVPGESSNAPEAWPRWTYPLRSAKAPASALVVPPASAFRHGFGALRALVRLTHGPDREPGLTRLPASTALQRFWTPTLRPDQEGLAVAASILQTTPAYRLASRSLPEARAGLEDLLSRK